MDQISDIDVSQCLGAGFLFLAIALAVLVVKPGSQIVTAVVAGFNLLISAIFLLTVGRDISDEPTYDVGYWLLSIVFALAMFLVSTIGLSDAGDLTQLLVFIIGFGLLLGIGAEVRLRMGQTGTDRSDRG